MNPISIFQKPKQGSEEKGVENRGQSALSPKPGRGKLNAIRKPGRRKLNATTLVFVTKTGVRGETAENGVRFTYSRSKFRGAGDAWV